MGTALGWARLSFKLQRSEIVFAALLSLGLAAAALWLTADMRAVLARCGTPTATEACNVVYAFQTSHGHAVQTIQMTIGFAQYAVPVVLGVPILTREIEQRTAMIAWPLAGSRLKWLAWRVAPVLIVGLAIIGTMAFAADQMMRAYVPHGDIGFQNHGGRGISMVTRAALVLVAAMAVGALVGRLLPALLISIALAVGVSAALDAVLPHWVESAELPQGDSIFAGANPLNTGFEYRAPDGGPIGNEEAEALVQAIYEEHGPEPDPSLLPQEVFFGVAASRYPEVLLRESAALVAATVLVGAMAVRTVQRRRPE
ncbi:MAG TPA: hypothetical protein VEW95_01940 [Candidatus Limnocylindrales bacterium]|nr:hypothetical protein [Candidatus Limnocylindrales bacterium]